MSLFTQHNVPFFSLVKKTCAFILSKKRFEYLAVVPSFCLIFITFFASRSFIEVDTPQGKMQSLNVVFALLFLVSVFLFFILSMLRAHLYYLNDDNAQLWRQKSFYVKGLFYILYFIAASLAGIFITAIWAGVFYAIVFYFLGVDGFSIHYFVFAALALSPYFIIRFCCIFPALAKGDKLFLFGAWKLTRGLASSLAINYVFVGFIPFFVVCIFSGVLSFLVQIGVPSFILNFLSIYSFLFALFFSAIFQAVFMNVVYDCLKERNLEQNVMENAFFSIAKNKNSD